LVKNENSEVKTTIVSGAESALQKLEEYLNKGMISKEVFESKKNEILNLNKN
jgi:malonyl CoA-acyl carrier protein transacylase